MQRFGFRKLTSGKIASVLLGVTIFGNLAFNTGVSKADTTDTTINESSVVEETEESGSVGTDSTAETNKAEKTRDETQRSTTSEQEQKLKTMFLAQPAATPKDDQPTAQELVDMYKSNDIDLKHAQKFLDYYNNLDTVTKIFKLDSADYGSGWIEDGLKGRIPNLSSAFIDKLVYQNSKKMVEATNGKIDAQLTKLEDLAKQYPDNQDIKDAIDKLNEVKANVTIENVSDAIALEEQLIY